ncbi:DUF3263 domain-containing protein [Phytohabitans rumicis]|uniref:DUF3263 domain-containing protein n=1 Tax=Phytohabitans rumicis TaxID=1076125 RepID=A0A6V8L819_9ACTN|nr:DUF3263 domain-containing protein [Phytohabitans rumicis]GFJ90961.1 hypothetical protein Prum_046030 [Phytohabitans rumicis]
MKPAADAPAVEVEAFEPDLDVVDTDLDTDAPAAVQAEPPLTEREQQILAFERKWWKHAGSKEQAIRDAFDLSATRYYQVLNGLLDNPAALEHDPVLIGRLRRIRSTRARTRRR